MNPLNLKHLLISLITLSLSFSLTPNLHADQETSWANQILQKMSLDEKIGQLFMIAGYVDPQFAEREVGTSQIIKDIDQYITQYHIGGIAFAGPSEFEKQVALTNHYQELTKYPLLIAQDLEWGLSMRLKEGMTFPKNITLGSIQDNRLIYEMGKEIGRQAKLIGVHMNLSPVLDVNIEPENIVINVRSFGDSPELVAEKGIAMIKGLQDAGVIASAKHFPGLGDITIDPHLDLPCSPHNKKRFLEIEFYPFAEAIKAGVLSIQTEHLMAPSLEPELNIPSSLSSTIVTDILKNELNFKGLILSGALRMKSLTKHFSDEEIAIRAFLAGNDMLLMPNNLPKAYQSIKSAFQKGKISEHDLDERVLKILQTKELAGLTHVQKTPLPTIDQLTPPSALSLKRKLFKSAVSIKRNQYRLIPINSRSNKSIAYVQIGESSDSTFIKKLQCEFVINSYMFSHEGNNEKEEARLFKEIDNCSLIILAVYPLDPRRIGEIRLLNENKQKEELKQFKVHGVTESDLRLIKIFERFQEKTIVTYFGNPFGLHFYDGFSTLIMACEPDPDAQDAAAQLMIYSCLQPQKL